MRSLILASLLLLTSNAAIADLLISGEIKARENQEFFAPKTDSWRVEVQWMKPEGEVAQQGEVVVVFDSGSIASQIEQAKVTLFTGQEELQRVKSNAEQAMLEAEFAVKRHQLLLEKARIDAEIPKANLSAYDYEKNQLELEKALIELNKSQEKLRESKITSQVNIAKQQLLIEKTTADLARNEKQLAQMSLTAAQAGPLIYGKHPWNGEKNFVGMTAQPGWSIAEIPSLAGLYIEAWIHEVDFHQLSLGKNASFKLDAYSGQEFSATITDISTQPEEKKPWGGDAYFRAEFSFSSKPTFKLIPGMSVQLALAGADNE